MSTADYPNVAWWILVVLADPIGIATYQGDEPDAVTIGNREFKDSKLGDVTLFYDWLRAQSGDVIGIRFWTRSSDFATTHEALQPYRSLPGVEVQMNDTWLVFFGGDRAFDDDTSNDQDFGDTRLLQSSDGSHAIAFQTAMLTSAEIASLSRESR